MHVATATLWTSTTTVVAPAGGAALVVDPGITPDDLAATARWLGAHGLRAAAAFATHGHWDHVLWATALGGGPRWATARAAAAATADLARSRDEADRLAPGHDLDLLARLVPLAPGTTALPSPAPAGCVVVEHRAHAPGHAGLVVPGGRGPAVLLAGDMLSDVEVPFLDTADTADTDDMADTDDTADTADTDGPLAAYRAGLDLLEAAVRAHDVAVLVPGHGTVARGRAAVAARFSADRAYLDRLAAAAAHDRPDPAPTAALAAAYDDLRLDDPWNAGEHAAQLAALRSARRG